MQYGGPAPGEKHSRQKRFHAVLALVCVLASVSWYGTKAASRRRAREGAARALEQLRAGNVRQAEVEAQAAERIEAADPAVQRALGSVRLTQGRLSEARAAFHRLAQLDSQAPHALCELAAVELRSGEMIFLDAAAEDGARAAELEPDCLRAQRAAGEALIAKGDTRRGIDFLRRASELDPSNEPLALLVQQHLLGAQRIEEATALALELTRRFPRSAQAHAVLGIGYLLHPPHSAEAARAPELFRTALRLDPRNLVANAQLGHYYLSRSDAKKAIPFLEVARSLAPTRDSVLFDLSRAYRITGRKAAADEALRQFRLISEREAQIAHLRRRLLLEPDDPDLARRLAALTAGGSKPAAANELLMRAPHQPDARYPEARP